jgi:hypothetical protein
MHSRNHRSKIYTGKNNQNPPISTKKVNETRHKTHQNPSPTPQKPLKTGKINFFEKKLLKNLVSPKKVPNFASQMRETPHEAKENDSVAQLVEQLTLNQWVESSSLSGVTRQNIKMQKTSEIQPISEVFRYPPPVFRRKILKQRGGRKGYTADRGVDCTLARVLIAIVQRFTPIPNL